MTQEEKNILLREIKKYIAENCYFTDGRLKHYDLWLAGWVAAEFEDRKNAMKVLIRNEYGLMGNLLNKLARSPDAALTRFIEREDKKVLIQAMNEAGAAVIRENKLGGDAYALRLLIEHDSKYAACAEPELLSSKPFLFSVVHCCPEILQRLPLRMFDDEAFALALIGRNHSVLKYLPYRFRTEPRICMEAARREGYALMFFDPETRERDDIVLAAVSSRGNALSLATPQQKKDPRIVAAAVNNCGLALSYADESLKGDRRLVSLAVMNRGMALGYAAEELRDCREIVELAVENDGYALRSASPRLRDDRALALKALSSYPEAYRYMSPRLQRDPEIIALYSAKKEEESKWLPSGTR